MRKNKTFYGAYFALKGNKEEKTVVYVAELCIAENKLMRRILVFLLFEKFLSYIKELTLKEKYE